MTEDEYNALWASNINLEVLSYRTALALKENPDSDLAPLLEELAAVISQVLSAASWPGTMEARQKRVFDLLNLREVLTTNDQMIGDFLVEYVRARMRELGLKRPSALIYDELANGMGYDSAKPVRDIWSRHKATSRGVRAFNSVGRSKLEYLLLGLRFLRKAHAQRPD